MKWTMVITTEEPPIADCTHCRLVQGCWSAWGARSLKRWAWKRERASAMPLETPGTWRALTKKLCFMEISTKNLTKSMMRGAFEWPWLIMATTLSLSHQNCKRLPENWGNHRAQATTIGKSSCHSMLIPRSLHWSTNNEWWRRLFRQPMQSPQRVAYWGVQVGNFHDAFFSNLSG